MTIAARLASSSLIASFSSSRLGFGSNTAAKTAAEKGLVTRHPPKWRILMTGRLSLVRGQSVQ
jgi:hypothetical protein